MIQQKHRQYFQTNSADICTTDNIPHLFSSDSNEIRAKAKMERRCVFRKAFQQSEQNILIRHILPIPCSDSKSVLNLSSQNVSTPPK